MTGRRRATSPDVLDAFDLAGSVSHLLRRAHFRAENLFVARLGDSGLTPRQKALLVAAHQNPGATLNTLADAVVLDRQTTAEMAHRLVARGLLERARSERDARAYAIWITPAGEDLLRCILLEDAEIEAEILAPLPPEYRPLFMKCLHLMAAADPSEQRHR